MRCLCANAVSQGALAFSPTVLDARGLKTLRRLPFLGHTKHMPVGDIRSTLSSAWPFVPAGHCQRHATLSCSTCNLNTPECSETLKVTQIMFPQVTSVLKVARLCSEAIVWGMWCLSSPKNPSAKLCRKSDDFLLCSSGNDTEVLPQCGGCGLNN